MAAGCVPHRGRRYTDYAVARLAWQADLGSHGGLSDVGRIKA